MSFFFLLVPHKEHLTSHEEEKSGDILHEIMLLAAAQHAYDPAEQDDGDGHADETGRHPLEVCTDSRAMAGFSHVPLIGLSWVGSGERMMVVRGNRRGGEESWAGGGATHVARATHPALLSSSD